SVDRRWRSIPTILRVDDDPKPLPSSIPAHDGDNDGSSISLSTMPATVSNYAPAWAGALSWARSDWRYLSVRQEGFGERRVTHDATRRSPYVVNPHISDRVIGREGLRGSCRQCSVRCRGWPDRGVPRPH